MFSHLSTRMFVLAAIITSLGLSLLAWTITRIHTRDLEAEVKQGAQRLSQTIYLSTRSSMLKNRKEDVYEIVGMVGQQPGIDRIRIFNKEGRITYSTLESERGSLVNAASESCTRCHAENHETPLAELRDEDRIRVFDAPEGHRVLGLTVPIYNEPQCSAAACHPSPDEISVLGVIDVQSSLAGVDAAVHAGNRRLFLLTYCFMLIIATTCGVFIWFFVHRPVKALITGTRRLGEGDLNHRIEVKSKTEVGRLAKSFNDMAGELSQARVELTEWARTLEQRVEERTKTLEQAQAKLLQNEKLASLGRLSAVVAHEINNPLSGVLTYTKLARKKLESEHAAEQLANIKQYLEATESEIVRCGKIVRNLLAFSRQSSMTVAEASINGLIDKVVFLVGHKLELQEVKLVKELDLGLPDITCDVDRIQQALMAVLINAIEAMPDGGTLRIRTSQEPDPETNHNRVRIEVGDSGCGIPEDVLPHLFEPFFTTKEDRNGVGLGLSVVYGIIKRHQGGIDVISRPGEGTTMVITLPERPEVEHEILDTGEDAADMVMRQEEEART